MLAIQSQAPQVWVSVGWEKIYHQHIA